MAEHLDENEGRSHVEIVSEVECGLKDILVAHEDYVRAHQYFEGSVNQKYTVPQLAKLLSGSENDFYVNLARRVVTAASDRLEITSITAETTISSHGSSWATGYSPHL